MNSSDVQRVYGSVVSALRKRNLRRIHLPALHAARLDDDDSRKKKKQQQYTVGEGQGGQGERSFCAPRSKKPQGQDDGSTNQGCPGGRMHAAQGGWVVGSGDNPRNARTDPTSLADGNEARNGRRKRVS